MAWQFLLAARELIKRPDIADVCLGYDSQTGLMVHGNSVDLSSCLWLDNEGSWCRNAELPPLYHALFDLYLPTLGNRKTTHRTTAHLGQSVDARIATRTGDSFFVTGEENRKHLHRLRALCDAVIVGAGTVAADDPQLTTRAVPGKNPVRVIIDPKARLKAPLKVFDDAQASTLLLHQSSARLEGCDMRFGPQLAQSSGTGNYQVERVIIPDTQNELSVDQIVACLRSRGLHRLFVEGGGVTVSKFFDAYLLDRLQIAVAPLLVGEGTAALQIEGVIKMMRAHRPPYALYRMGEDVLWDFDVCAIRDAVSGATTADKKVRDKEVPQLAKCSVFERIL